MSVILEALQKAHTSDGKRSPSESRVVDVRPANGVKIKTGSSLRVVWLCVSVLILLLVGAAGAGAFYWVMEHRSQFTFGFSPVPASPAAPARVPRLAEERVQKSVEPAKPADLPPPVPIQTVAQLPAVSTQALPPPPVAPNVAAPAAAAIAPAASPAAVASAPLFSLGTILCGDGNDCAAIVNGKTLHRGEMIKEHRVMDITATEVRLQHNTEPPIVLSLLR